MDLDISLSIERFALESAANYAFAFALSLGLVMMDFAFDSSSFKLAICFLCRFSISSFKMISDEVFSL